MPTPSHAVLLVTHSADHFTVDRVHAGVARRGGTAIRLDTDRFPTDCQLTIRVEGGVALRGRVIDSELPLDAIAAVWMRRVFAPPRPAGLDDIEAAQCARETRATLDAVFAALDHAAWLDPRARVRDAENKLVQLRAATRAGLPVPRTVIGNDPDEVRALWQACRGAVVAKMLTAVTRSMGAPSAAVYTRSLTETDLDDLDGLALAPMVFQERIDKRRELRVVYVAGRCFTASLAATDDDWRRTPAGGASPWRIDALPVDIAARFAAVMSELGLRFGAADFLEDHDGGYHFLEVNPAGEWGMLERDLELPIADAIAEELCQRR